jgi:hypothetical protein
MMITGVHGRFIAGKCPPCPAAASTEWVDRIPRPYDDPHRGDIPPEFGVPSLPAGSGGSGGGGASDVRTGAADDTGLPTRLIVAGGGGGAAGAAGGDGGLEGAPGGDGSVVFNLPDVFPTRLVQGGTPGAGAQGVGAPGADGTDAFIEFVGGRPMARSRAMQAEVAAVASLAVAAACPRRRERPAASSRGQGPRAAAPAGRASVPARLCVPSSSRTARGRAAG